MDSKPADMQKQYTDEKNALVLMALLKMHGIRKIIASPGTTNMALIGSMQSDPYFEMYSSVDERSAAYMACGLAAESGEAVVISCTGATASRNYLPGLTEAFYRKLPVLAVTSTQALSRVGHHVAQVIDRSTKPVDSAKLSVSLPVVKDGEDLWDCEIKVNRAILELKRHGGGPVHINLPTTYSKSFEIRDLPRCRFIERFTVAEQLPELPRGRIVIFVGAHKPWSREESAALDAFCESHDAVVICDHTSGYNGPHRVLYSLLGGQSQKDQSSSAPELVIHIGEVTGDYYGAKIEGSNVWRVSEDGEIRDPFRRLRCVFEMSERFFFMHYAGGVRRPQGKYLAEINQRLSSARDKIPELPFSNVWLASRLAAKIPPGSVVHFGILNSLRAWNFFDLPTSVQSASNVGGFGIDGGLSTLIGASLSRSDRLYFAVIGDLAFFYDMNVLGNRHVGKNIRVLLINNGKGTEFRQYGHHASDFGDAADDFIAAAGHFGRKSRALVRHYAEDLGFEYFMASDKLEFDQVYSRFLVPEITDRPMLFEVFTDSTDESKALEAMLNVETTVKGNAKNYVKSILGNKAVGMLKSLKK